VALYLIYTQDYKIKNYVPTQCKIIKTDIIRKVSHSSKGGTSVSYKPVVKYKSIKLYLHRDL
jgi:hypothetical protein